MDITIYPQDGLEANDLEFHSYFTAGRNQFVALMDPTNKTLYGVSWDLYWMAMSYGGPVKAYQTHREIVESGQTAVTDEMETSRSIAQGF